jgi:hypothetical protein
MSHRDTILIRSSTEADVRALARLASLDSSLPIAGPALVAEVDGTMRAALPIDGTRAIADPFAETAHLLDLLRAHASALRAATREQRSRAVLAPATV